jgi:ribosomal protein L31
MYTCRYSSTFLATCIFLTMNTALYEQSPKDGNVSSRPPSPIRQTFVEPATLSVQSEGFGCNSQPKGGKDSSDSGSDPEWTLGDEGKPFNNGGPTGWTLVEPTKGDTSDDEGSKSIGHSEEACSNCGRTLPRTEVSHSNKSDELEYDNLANVCTACHPSDRWTGKQKSVRDTASIAR